eukprot:11839286-Karenia_brevis.AAC.1
MLSLGANPRTLADDLLLTSCGNRALHVFQAGFEATIRHLMDLGGRLAPSKSKLFASTSTHRSWLSTYIWRDIGQQIPVVLHMRDLGATLNTTVRTFTTLSQQRFACAIQCLLKIHRLPHIK